MVVSSDFFTKKSFQLSVKGLLVVITGNFTGTVHLFN